ncbi:MAG: transcriptional repressor LexA [Limnochordia bacterium]
MDLGDKIKARRLELGLTLEDVGDLVGVSKSTVAKWETGYIENMRRDKIALLAQALRVSPLWILGMEDTKSSFRVKKVPLLGEIAAGEPVLAHDDCKTYVEVNGTLQVDFCLRVTGDSMVDARIHDGDLVFVRQQPIVENGEIAVVLIDNEATLKRFYKNDGGVILKPENSNYQPRFYTEKDFRDIRVLGKAVLFQSLL